MIHLPLIKEGVIFFMGEALITSRTGTIGDSNGSGNNGAGLLKTEIFKLGDVFIVPKAKDQQFSVRIFGGGGGGASVCVDTTATSSSKRTNNGYAGGGGGWMNNAILILNQGQQIPISIGKGGKGKYSNIINISGGTGGTTSFGTYLSALGGNGGFIKDLARVCAGNGGSGGGSYSENSNSYIAAGIGYQFGGGFCYRLGGNGGKWGGGGGGTTKGAAAAGGCLYENGYDNSPTGYSGLAGNGGTNNTKAQNGTSTIGNNEIDDYLQGAGLCGINTQNASDSQAFYSSGGGGYGGCGAYYGGGGGYGANGGMLGGGGGYGGSGGANWGGGGAYGDGGSDGSDGSFGGGGGAAYQQAGNGGNGLCIIQYYPE